ncbi:MAG TPA: hypothetical protein VIK76_05440 [Pyrinomonadaceae bacterium]|jgi:hypothetical protein
MRIALFVAFSAFGLLLLFYSYEAYHLRKKAKEHLADIQWNIGQLERALVLVRSENRDEILAGLHIMSAINHPSRLHSLSRLAQLARHPDPQIREAALRLIDKMGYSGTKHPIVNEQYAKVG